MENINEAIEVLLANRVHLYELFHTVFGSEPTVGLLCLLSSPATSQAFALLSEKEDDIMAKMSSFVKKQETKYVSDPEYLSCVKAEYTRLMIGPGRLIAYPWESACNGKENLLFQESTLHVRKAYLKYGYLPEQYPRVADDHIALELHFMARLSEMALGSFRKDDTKQLVQILKDQHVFMKYHLLNWLPKYVQNISKSKTMYLYPQFALAVSEFVRMDSELITEILEALKENVSL